MLTNKKDLIKEQKHNFQKRAVGVEFQVNSYTTNDQEFPHLAGLTTGDFVIVWTSQEQDLSYSEIYAQRVTSTGVKSGSEFRVNTYTTGTQENPRIAALPSGYFVVVWESNGQDGNLDGIYGQRFNSGGVKQGSEFKINTYTSNNQREPALAVSSTGDFVVVWDSQSQDPDVSQGVYGQRYTSAAVVQGSEFRVNTYTTNAQSTAQVDYLSTGGFVVVWEGYGSQDGDNYGIFAQRFSSTAVKQGGEFQVNSYTTSGQQNPRVSASAGGFVVTWYSSGQDDDASTGVYAQHYSDTGTVQGSEFRINTYTTNTQNLPTMCSLPDSNFIVVWESAGQEDGASTGLYAKRFNNLGVALSSEVHVNTYTTGSQRGVEIAALSNGDFVVTWYSSGGQDGDLDGIFAHIFPSDTGLTTTAVSSSVTSSVSSSVSSSYTSAISSSATSGSTTSFPSGLTTDMGLSSISSTSMAGSAQSTASGNSLASSISTTFFSPNSQSTISTGQASTVDTSSLSSSITSVLPTPSETNKISAGLILGLSLASTISIAGLFLLVIMKRKKYLNQIKNSTETNAQNSTEFMVKVDGHLTEKSKQYSSLNPNQFFEKPSHGSQYERINVYDEIPIQESALPIASNPSLPPSDEVGNPRMNTHFKTKQ